MKKKVMVIVKNLAWPLVALMIILALWLACSVFYGNSFLLPKPSNVAAEMGSLLTEKAFWSALFDTLKRCVLSLLLSLVTALTLAILSMLCQPLRKILMPIVTIFRAIPTMSVILVLTLVFTPKTAPIFVTFLVVMPLMYSMLITSFLAVPKELIETGRVFGFGKIGEIARIHLPLSLPAMIESVSSGFSLSLKILVAAEVLSSTANSIGYLLTLANMNIEMARLIAITVIAITLCIVVELGFRCIFERVSKDLY